MVDWPVERPDEYIPPIKKIIQGAEESRELCRMDKLCFAAVAGTVFVGALGGLYSLYSAGQERGRRDLLAELKGGDKSSPSL